MITAILAIISGFIALTWSADKFVAGSAATARNWNISPMLIGLTVVSIGTSAPEILVSIMAASQNHGDIAVGNAIGSNIANLGLVLGITAIIAPLPIKQALAKRELPWLAAITLIAGGCLMNGYLGVIDSFILLTGLVATLYLMIRWQKHHPEEPLAEADELPELTSKAAYIQLLGGLTVLLLSSQVLVWGASRIAELLGVSELIIGLTIVAIGTSLPELAASVMSALRQHHDIALGNVVGSNIFNLLAVLPMPGLISPGTLDESVIIRDYPVMLGLTLLVLIMAMTGHQPRKMGRLTGAVLLLGYCFYGGWLYIQSS